MTVKELKKILGLNNDDKEIKIRESTIVSMHSCASHIENNDYDLHKSQIEITDDKIIIDVS